MECVLGIDLGTTNSLCAVLEGRRPVLVPNARGSFSTPSVVALSARGELLVGESARNQALANPGGTVFRIKRRLATEGLVAMGDRGWRPEELAALVLGSLKADAERHLGRPVVRAVLAAPAHFADRGRRSLLEAGRLAGLAVERIVNEPTAAALARIAAAAGGRAAAGGPARNLLVYDFGGGTFDVTLLRQEGAECAVLSSRGDGELGGADLDRELYRRAAADFAERWDIDPASDPRLELQLLELVERAKIELSEREEASVVLPFARASGRGGPTAHPRRDFSRAEFEELARPYVERSLALVRATLADAGLAPGQVDALVLSGGSSRVPLVRRLLAEAFDREPEAGYNPEEIVALGAAVAGGLAGGGGAAGAFGFRDVVSRTYGVGIEDGRFVPLIRKNSPVPAVARRTFTTIAEGQDSVEIHVLQGESRRWADNLSLGRFLLGGIRKAAAGEPRIGVEFSIDESDILRVSARDLDTGAAQAISIADLDRGAADGTPAEVAAKLRFLVARITELRAGLRIEGGFAAELEDAAARALAARPEEGEGALRLLKAELEGLVGELLARRAEGPAA